MSGKHVKENALCDAVYDEDDIKRFGFKYLPGSKCTAPMGHDTPRNGVGHYYAVQAVRR